jgi:tetratricopeptide (TPR) repeat protein
MWRFFFFLSLASSLAALEDDALFAMERVKGQSSLQSIYTSLDPTSVSQHFAFYELYPDTSLGKQALRHAWNLLNGGEKSDTAFPSMDIEPLIAHLNRPPESHNAPILSSSQLQVIGTLSRHLKNRGLKGYGLWDRKTLVTLKSDEIDLSRALLLAEIDEDTPETRQKIESYEAHIDLIALQILARLPDHPTPQDKIRIINDTIFGDMRFRFPPHSLSVKEIDVYTMLPSILDSRRGVCLGVSILYLCLAQRLDLSLEAITPPGHIYVRHVDPASGEILNIETTARGIDIPSERYLGLETRQLQRRTVREVVGLAFMNQAARFWHHEDSKTAVKLYEKAKVFLEDDYLLQMFLGFNYLFEGRTEEGVALLKKVQGVIPEHMIVADTVSEDYLAGYTDAAGLLAIFQEVDEKRASIQRKQKKLEEVVEKHPKFRQGLLHLAITHLQLGREKEALPFLLRYITLHPSDPVVNYYLSAIYLQRVNFREAWRYLKKAEVLVAASNHDPRALKDLRKELERACPEPPAI